MLKQANQRDKQMRQRNEEKKAKKLKQFNKH